MWERLGKEEDGGGMKRVSHNEGNLRTSMRMEGGESGKMAGESKIEVKRA